MTDEEKYNRKPWMSDDQWECWQFVRDLYFGWHHVGGKVHEWGRGIAFNTTRTSKFATYDFDSLTTAVFMAHERMIRFSIEPSGPGMLKLVLHKRHKREGSMFEKHPTIEEAIARFRK